MSTENKQGLQNALAKARNFPPVEGRYAYQIQPPKLAPGVVPSGKTAPVMAMDYNHYQYAQQTFPGGGFPGFPYLSQLATRAEYRAFASTLSTELTREWIEFTSKEDDESSAERIKQIEDEFKSLGVQSIFQTAAEHDCYFGRAQILIKIKGADPSKPLILDRRTIKPGSLERISAVEAIWTTPSSYNADDPSAPDFYRPSSWFMLGQEVHASRLMTIITRPLPDILKPAFNFAGISLSQLAEAYVDNWLRTRQSVSDLINNFSITSLATSMDQVLQGNDDGAALFDRAELFTRTRSNKGLMLIDKDEEEILQVNTPLSGLHELQAQSQEQMCSVSRTPAIILTGISPSGLNASSEGEIRTFYDWVAAQQTAYWREPLETILKVVQLSLFGEIDPNIGINFIPLFQMTPKEEAEIRLSDMQAGTGYINAGVIDPMEERERLAQDPLSGYQGLNMNVEIVPPNNDDPFAEGDPAEQFEQVDPAEPTAEQADDDGGILQAIRKLFGMAHDAEFKEEDHPRADNGQFGKGSGAGKESPAKTDNTSKEDNFAKGGIDDKGFERAPDLDETERKIEQRFYDDIEKNAPELIGAYRSINGNVIDPDLVKALDPQFAKDPSLARAVHEPSSYLSKRIYSEALDRKAAEGDTSPTLFSAGGGGSGKSATRPVAEALLGADPDGLFYDSTLSSFKSAQSRIDEALKKTKGDVGIVYTNTPIATALDFNAKRSRTVSIDTLLHAHVGASNTVRKLAEHYKDDPRVQIAIINNRKGQDPTPGDVADVPKYNQYQIREQLVRRAKSMLDDGTIDKTKYNLLVK